MYRSVSGETKEIWGSPIYSTFRSIMPAGHEGSRPRCGGRDSRVGGPGECIEHGGTVAGWGP